MTVQLEPEYADNSSAQVFVNDRLLNATRLVSVNSDGITGNSDSIDADISADGRFVAMYSRASNFVANDTNNDFDLFVRDRGLKNSNSIDLAITANQQPLSISVNNIGHYSINVINKGTQAVSAVQLNHIVSNGNITALTPSQGHCKSYSAISLCTFTSGLQVGQSATLTVDVKATGGDLSQSISINNGSSTDPVKTNNYLTLTTPVIP